MPASRVFRTRCGMHAASRSPAPCCGAMSCLVASRRVASCRVCPAGPPRWCRAPCLPVVRAGN